MKHLVKILSALLLLVTVSCDSSQTKTDTTLKVGLTADYPPFEFMQNNQIVGYDVDLIQAIAQDLNKKVEIIDMDFDGLIPALQTGRIDCIVSGMTATDARKKNVDFSIEYYTPQFAMLYLKDAPINSVKELDNKIVAVQLGTSLELYLKDQVDSVEKLNILSLKKYPAMVQELISHRVNGVFLEEPQAAVFAKNNPELGYAIFPTGEMGYSIALAKDSPLKEQFDQAINQLNKDGVLKKLKDKWLMEEQNSGS